MSGPGWLQEFGPDLIAFSASALRVDFIVALYHVDRSEPAEAS